MGHASPNDPELARGLRNEIYVLKNTVDSH